MPTEVPVVGATAWSFRTIIGMIIAATHKSNLPTP
jgi:hypothetical protein